MGQSDDGGTSAANGAANAAGLNILSGFEGEIDLLVKGKGTKANQPVSVALDVKGDKVRGDVPQGIEGADKLGKAAGIYNAPEKKMYVVLDAQKKVIVLDLNKSGEQLRAMKPPSAPPGPGSPPAPPATPPTITKTGKSDTVAGYSCEIWEIVSHDPKEKGKAQVCVAQQGVSWFHIPMTGVPAEYAFMSELGDGNHFPLRLVAFDEASVEQMRIEVTKIEKKTLDPSLFEPPPGYQQIDLAQMFSAMSGGAGGRPGMPAGIPGMPGIPGGPPHHGPPGH